MSVLQFWSSSFLALSPDRQVAEPEPACILVRAGGMGKERFGMLGP